MRQIKLFVVFVFLLIFGLSFGQKFISPRVSGQTGSNALSAPTNLIASDGNYSTKIGLNWDTIRGATSYRIFRNTVNDPTSAADLGTTPAPNFFDTSAVVNQTFFYWVRAENGAIVSDFSASDQGIRANGTIGQAQPLNPPPPAPPGNPLTATKVYLGKTLFWDEQLSSTRTVACGSCHHSNNGGSDPRTFLRNQRSTNPGADQVFGTTDDIFGSPGVPVNNLDGTYVFSSVYGLREQVTSRKSLSYINAGYSDALFWDGRAGATFRDPITNAIILNNNAALESQVLGPPVNSAEMAHTGRDWNNVASRITESKPLALSPNVPLALKTWINNRNYPELFTEAFGTSEVTPARIAMAIATFERSLYSDRTPFDQAVSNIAPLTAAEQRGQNIFNGQARCNTCHAGALFSDNQFHNIGLRPQNEDTGRFQVTANPNDLGEFRTPSLRNVELRSPYMHTGQFQTLEEVVDFYNRGGDFDAPNIDRNRIRPINLTPQQKADLVAFLKRPLTDSRVAAQISPFDRPTLYAESSRVPQITGNGMAGTGAIVPQAMAIEPPFIGNPSFTVAVFNALGNAQATLVIDATDPGTGSAPAAGSFARVTINTSGAGAGNGSGSVSLVIPNNASFIGKTFFGRWYVADANAPNGFAVTPAFKFTIFGDTPLLTKAKLADFDGDGKTDLSVFRPTEGNWYISNSSNNNSSTTSFGENLDLPAPEDFDGDGKADVAVYRNGVWYVLRSQAGLQVVSFGLAGDRPQPGDYDGDGRADVAVFRPSTGVWYILQSRDGFKAVSFGISTDRPVASDYDGDGKTDIAVYRDGVWYLLQSTKGISIFQFGTQEDKPVIGDYDGDGKSDAAVFRPSTGVWYYLRSSSGSGNSFSAVQFGIATDIPVPGDYDGDGKSDPAVWRPSEGNWYILRSSDNAFRVLTWGLSQDISVPSVVVP